jgi:DNA-binding NarL/FixJ family response regulator
VVVIASAARVLIVTHDPHLRDSLARPLRRAAYDPVEAVDGEHALALAAADPPAVAVLDVGLPDVHGFEVCRELRERHGEDVAIVLVSGEQVEMHDRIAGLLIGADEYLVTPIDEAELLARLRRLLARSNRRERRAQPLPEHRNDMTARELQVLALLAQGLDAAGIARELVISPKTVASHLQHLMPKLGVHNRAQAVARAYEVGLLEVGSFDVHAPPPSTASGADGPAAS